MNSHFYYHHGELFSEKVSIKTLVSQWGTPCYIYSNAAIIENWKSFKDPLQNRPHRICYAVKANSNIAILNILAKLGSGFDIVSGGELERVLRAGGKPGDIVFSGIGKQVNEIKRALEVGIYCFNVESAAELLRINEVAGKLNKKASIALRINPDIDSGSHPYISTGLKENKFGIDISEALVVYEQARNLPNIKIEGIAFHIGSQLMDLAPLSDALKRVLSLIEALSSRGIELKHIDVGGGLGVKYRNEKPPTPQEYVKVLTEILPDHSLELILEPGRAIVANAGILVTRVEYLKHTSHKNFAIVDAAKNDLLRPALYGAWQNIVPVELRKDISEITYDVVGPVCETGDFLGKDRILNIQSGDLLAIESVGAYGFVMGSNYNSRPRAVELLIDGENVHCIRRRETIEDLISLETIMT